DSPLRLALPPGYPDDTRKNRLRSASWLGNSSWKSAGLSFLCSGQGSSSAGADLDDFAAVTQEAGGAVGLEAVEVVAVDFPAPAAVAEDIKRVAEIPDRRVGIGHRRNRSESGQGARGQHGGHDQFA